ncbi:MAG: efflux RND transporter periplasmic adaptor subunit [Anaerolineae bacterium]|jgi:multidrug resistance efflux pump|nr:efflux RND transporter periplasmic adaptor subunit [Anaerolineae bacterium]MDH7475558.1 efflux RND transporter periplasmic adaptor subunit [Anaerolineae bacterium]
MRKRLLAGLILLLLIASGGVGWWYLSAHPTAQQQILARLRIEGGQSAQGIFASGTIEVEEVAITAEIGGRILEILADEGDVVRAGEPIVRLDDALLQAHLEEARAAVEVARAGLARVQAGVRPGTIRQAEASLAQAIAARNAARQAWQDLLAVRDNPQELEDQIDQARTRLAQAESQVKQAEANVEAAKMLRDSARHTAGQLNAVGVPSITLPPSSDRPMSLQVSPDAYATDAEYRLWQAWVQLNSATAARDSAQQYLNDLLAIHANPQELNAQVDSAKAQYESAQAAVAVAEAQLAALQAGPSEEQVAAARAQVQQAEAALATLEVQLAKTLICAPGDGIVVERVAHVGELAVPGVALLTIANLDEVTLTVYIPEKDLGRVQLGQVAEVTVDAYPDRIFRGQVVYIASEAEFTPKNVQTKEERVNTVFAVKVRIPNPDHALKPGIPADAVL